MSSSVIEAFGTTKLVQTGNNYFLDPVLGGAGPELTLNNSPVFAGQFPGWSAVAAEKTSTGYKVALKATNADQFIVWTLDKNGAYLTNDAPTAGTSNSLKSAEAVFQQDLNGDGVIGNSVAMAGAKQ